VVTWLILGILFVVVIMLNSARTRAETQGRKPQPRFSPRPSPLPPPQPMPSPLPTPPAESYQPPYATAVERRTVRRDQAVLDRDRRTESRTEPTQAPAIGSTAIESTALDTTLATPYQPSSLFTSTSSSLSSSLFDSAIEPSQTMGTLLDVVTTVTLPKELREQVVLLLREGNQVEAVRIVIDELDVSLLEASKAVQAYAIR
jgi:hypothetical protein